MDNKTNLRFEAKKIRNNLDMADISNKIIENITNLEIYLNAKNIMIFYPLKNEINLLPLLDDNKQFYLPRISNNDIECCPYKKGDKLIKSAFGVLEPISEPSDKNIQDIIFVPALAVNRHGYRLGYGKGFYDRFLKNCHAKTIIPIPSELIFEQIYEQEHDIPCDIIITQKKASVERG